MTSEALSPTVITSIIWCYLSSYYSVIKIIILLHNRYTGDGLGCRFINKLAGSTCGARTSTLWTATLALCFSVAEYCAPIWCRSTHMKLVGSSIQQCGRSPISGSIMSTPVQWLLVLSNTAPATLRRNSVLSKILNKILLCPNLPAGINTY